MLSKYSSRYINRISVKYPTTRAILRDMHANVTVPVCRGDNFDRVKLTIVIFSVAKHSISYRSGNKLISIVGSRNDYQSAGAGTCEHTAHEIGAMVGGQKYPQVRKPLIRHFGSRMFI